SWPGPLDTVTALAFSPDGRTAVSGEWGAVRVWDAATGKVLRGPSDPFQVCYALAFSPDGKMLVVGGAALHFLDGRTLRERRRTPVEIVGNGEWISRHLVDVSPDGTLTAAVGTAGEILLVDPRLGKVVRTLRRRGWLAHSVAFGPDGKHLYAVSPKD